jgi:hypothetical protein
LQAVQAMFPETEGKFCAYAVAAKDLHHPENHWQGTDTYIQKEGIERDLGVYDNPDQFYATHGRNLAGLRLWLYKNSIRHLFNRNVQRIRDGRARVD